MARSKSTQSTNSRAKKRPPAPPPPTWDEQLINRLMPWRVEIVAMLVFILAVVTFLAMPGWTTASWLGWWTNLLRQTFGWGAYALSLSVAAASLHVALRKVERPYHIRTPQVIGIELVLLTALPLSHQLTNASLPDAYLGKGGGLVGWALSEPLRDFFGPFLTTLFYFSLLAYGVALITGYGWNDMLRGLNTLSLRLRLWAQRIAPVEREDNETETDLAPSIPAPQSNLVDNPDELVIINDSAPDQPYQRRRDKRQEEAKRVMTALQEIQRASKFSRMIALNAKISADKAGPYGKEFGALTEELKNISSAITSSSEDILKHLTGL